MKLFYKLIILCSVAFTFLSCRQQKSYTFSLKGDIQNPKRDYIILKKNNDIEQEVSSIIDTIPLGVKGKFEASYFDEPYIYSLEVDNQKTIPLAINKGQNLTINVIDSMTYIKGSIDTEALINYEAFRKKSLDSLVISVRKTIKQFIKENKDQQLMDSVGKLEVKNYEIHLEELNNYIKKNMANTVGLYATSIRWKNQKNFALYDSLTTEFEKKYPNLGITKKLREKLTRLQQTNVGGTASDIEMKSVKDEVIKLSTITKKYTLIDFWASWCGPCRRESESLNTIYNTYKNQGFEIYGISLDSDKSKWMQAIEKDNRTWINVTSLQAFKTPAAYNYAVTSLPVNYLIDENMKIIAKDIHGQQLEELLKKLFD